MSRIGKMPVPIPQGVEINLEGRTVSVKGPRGALSREIDADMQVKLDDSHLLVTRPSEQARHRAMHGLTRSLIANMVSGVSDGFSKTLEMQGVGYRAQMQGPDLMLSVGYSHPVQVAPPPGIQFEVEGTTRIVIRGIDKQLVGQVAADVRKVRPPEPYKGKGIRYLGEYVRRKAGKAGKAAR